MGEITFLTGGGYRPPQSLDESIYQLENTSVVFLAAWGALTRDLHRAARASQEAMVHLDHIVNEILRARDHLKANNTYSSSALKAQLDINRAVSLQPVTRAQQLALPQLGPGNGNLPSPGAPLTFERLLNKIKHRRHDASNFRIGHSGEHVFLIAVDKPDQQPDSIVEFVVSDFCAHCKSVSPHI